MAPHSRLLSSPAPAIPGDGCAQDWLRLYVAEDGGAKGWQALLRALHVLSNGSFLREKWGAEGDVWGEAPWLGASGRDIALACPALALQVCRSCVTCQLMPCAPGPMPLHGVARVPMNVLQHQQHDERAGMRQGSVVGEGLARPRTRPTTYNPCKACLCLCYAAEQF
jgi:hypothetical protein